MILPASTALTRLAPPSFLAATTFNFKQKSRLDEAALRAQLTLAGYSHVSSVVSPGEYAVRGGLIDLFPMGSNVPYRVDLFDNEVDSIRTFDPDTQRSLYPVPQVRLLPGREFALDEASRKAFRVRWRERIEGDPTKARLYKDMGNGIAGGGIEYYLPLFFDETGDDLRLPARLGHAGAARRGRRRAAALLDGHPRAPPLPQGRPGPPDPAARGHLPEERAVLRRDARVRDAVAAAARRPRGSQRRPRGSTASGGSDGRSAGATAWARPLPDVSVERGATAPMARLQKHIDATPYRVLLVADSEGRRETLLDMLRDHAIEPISVGTLAEFEASDEKVAITAAPISEGFFWFEPEARGASARSSSSPRTSCSPPAPRRAGAAAGRSRPAASTR